MSSHQNIYTEAAKSIGFMVFILAQISFVSNSPPIFYLLLFAIILPGLILAIVSNRILHLNNRGKLMSAVTFILIASLPGWILGIYLEMNRNSSSDTLIAQLNSEKTDSVIITDSIDFLLRATLVMTWSILFFLYEYFVMRNRITDIDRYISLSGLFVWLLYYLSKWFAYVYYGDDDPKADLVSLVSISVGALAWYLISKQLKAKIFPDSSS